MLSDAELYTAGMKKFKTTNTNEINYYGLGIEVNSAPYNSNVGILVTSYRKHLQFLKATLTNYRKSGNFVLCAYDTPLLPTVVGTLSSNYFPPNDIYLLAHAWVHKHITHDAMKRNGWFWDVKYGFGILDQFEFDYIFCVNGDCIWEKPEGVDEIIDLLGDGDLMSDASASDRGGPIHTCSVIYRIDALREIVNYMSKQMKVPVFGSHNPEQMLKDSVKYLELKEVRAPKQPIHPNGRIDHYHTLKEDCTWKEVLGFRNLGAEAGNWYNPNSDNKPDMPPVEYTDLRFATIYEKKYAEKWIREGNKLLV